MRIGVEAKLVPYLSAHGVSSVVQQSMLLGRLGVCNHHQPYDEARSESPRGPRLCSLFSY